MKKIFAFIVKSRLFFLIFWGIFLAGSIFLIPLVKINYDTTKYLPGNSKTLQSLKVMEEEFGLNGQASIMIEDITISDALFYRQRLSNTDGVLEVIWIDSFLGTVTNIEAIINLLQTLNITLFDVDAFFIEQDSVTKKGSALFQILFEEDQYSLETGKSIERLKDKLDNFGKPYAMSGQAVSSYYTRKMTSDEVFKITLYVIPIVLVILFIFTNSWIEPLLFIIVVAASVLINMGTNIIFPSISFLTNSTASLLQLAITMDYAIFLLHRYTKERKAGLSNIEAVKKAMYESFLPINSSMLTTVAGFTALIFMRYTIGADLALVMIKGILLSIIITFSLMPPLLVFFDKLLIKTEHKPIFPSLKKLTTPIYKLRFILPLLVVLVIIPSFTYQNKNHFVYGKAAMSSSEGTKAFEDIKKIEQTFGKSNPIVILVPNGNQPIDENNPNNNNNNNNIDYKEVEKSMVNKLTTSLAIYKPAIQSLAAMPDYMIGFVPEKFKEQLVGEYFNRIIISIQTDEESEEAYNAIAIIKSVAAQYYDDYHIIGSSSAVLEIKTIVENDYLIINALSIVLVLIILFFSFKSLLIPFILVLSIEMSVWINMSIPYLTKQPLIFIGYIIVSSVQLGATIDYGILLTQNYMTARKSMKKKDAFIYSITSSGHSILTSSLILAAAGYALYFVSSIEGVSGLGELIGRGALLSGFFVLFLLPQLLYLLDKYIAKTTKGANFYQEKSITKEEIDPES